ERGQLLAAADGAHLALEAQVGEGVADGFHVLAERALEAEHADPEHQGADPGPSPWAFPPRPDPPSQKGLALSRVLVADVDPPVRAMRPAEDHQGRLVPDAREGRSH